MFHHVAIFDEYLRYRSTNFSFDRIKKLHHLDQTKRVVRLETLAYLYERLFPWRWGARIGARTATMPSGTSSSLTGEFSAGFFTSEAKVATGEGGPTGGLGREDETKGGALSA